MDHLKIVINRYEESLKKEKKLGFPLESRRYLLECLRDLYASAHEAGKTNKPIAWISIATPVEIFHAMDIVPFGVEQFSIQTLATLMKDKLGYQLFDKGAKFGIPREACSAHLATVGMAAENFMPAPDVLVCAVPPCDSSTGMFDVLGNMFNAPTFLLDSSYRSDDAAVDYLKQEYESLIEFLEENTGHKMDYKKLENIVRLSKEADDYSNEIQETRKLVPCPVHARELLGADVLKMMCSGLPKFNKVWRALYDETKEKVDRGEGVIPDEKHRVIFMFTYPMHSMKIVDWLQKEHKAVPVLDTTNLLPQGRMDVSDPLRAIATRILKVPSIRLSREHWGDICGVGAKKAITDRCKEFKVDGSIFFASWSCQQSALLNRLYKDAMKTIDIPTLVLDGDHYDARVVPLNDMQSKIDDYFGILEGR